MNLQEAARRRHSVRQYTTTPLSARQIQTLQHAIEQARTASHLEIELVTQSKAAFAARLPKYGSFVNVANYIVLAGPKTPQAEEQAGYVGEGLVLLAQTLGLNTCWVGLTVAKNKIPITLSLGSHILMVIALGYGATQGTPHKQKKAPADFLLKAQEVPDWFMRGLEAVELAPSAVHQQKYRFSYDPAANEVEGHAGRGFYTNVDLGIAKYHFELGAGKENVHWKSSPSNKS